MVKSLLITFYFPPSVGGIEDYLANICASISDQIVVLAPKVKDYYKFDQKQNYKIYRYNFYYSYIAKYPKLYRLLIFPILFLFVIRGLKIIKKGNIDIIQCGSADFSLAAWCLGKLTKKPYLVYAYGKDISVKKNSLLSRIWKKTLISFALKKSKGVITISQFSKTKLIELGVQNIKIEIVNPCIKEGKFYHSIEEGISIKRRYQLENRKVLLSVGRLVERKGYDYVIKSLPLVLKQIPNTTYLIVGSGTEKGQLCQLVNSLKLEENVVFTGYAPDNQLNSYYNACDIFIMPSRELPGDVEGFGIVYLEANACGKPVIGGKTGGIRDAIIDRETGLLVNPYDIKEISSAIIRLLSDTKFAEKLGEQGFKRVKDNFSISIMSNKIDIVINITFG